MGITHSILIVILLAILVCLLHKTKHPYLYPMLLNAIYLCVLFRILPQMKLANMEESGTILVCGFMIVGLIDVIITRVETKR